MTIPTTFDIRTLDPESLKAEIDIEVLPLASALAKARSVGVEYGYFYIVSVQGVIDIGSKDGANLFQLAASQASIK